MSEHNAAMKRMVLAIAAPACSAIGAVTGVAYWGAAKQHREGPQLYAYCTEPAPGAESDCKEYE